MSSQQIQSSKMTKQNSKTNKMTKPRTLAPKPLAPKPLAPKPLAPLVLNPISTPSQNQMFSGFKMSYRTDILTPSFQYLENESNEINKEFEYSLQESSETDNSFREKIIPVDILNMDTQSFDEEDSTVSIKSSY
jgi:hypothetical protein